MAKLTVDGRYSSEFLKLGVQTNVGRINETIIFKVKAWAPSRAKSARVFDVINTDYHGMPLDHETGYAYFKVEYFSGKNEGLMAL